jgi:hypothetical protein
MYITIFHIRMNNSFAFGDMTQLSPLARSTNNKNRRNYNENRNVHSMLGLSPSIPLCVDKKRQRSLRHYQSNWYMRRVMRTYPTAPRQSVDGCGRSDCSVTFNLWKGARMICIIRCGWCREMMRIKFSWAGLWKHPFWFPISHGICPDCERKEFIDFEYEEQKRKTGEVSKVA